MLEPCKNDLKCQTNILYFILTWLTSEFHSLVLVSVTAFEIFTGEKIFAYLHHWVIELWRKTNLTNIQSWIYFLFNLALIQFLQKHWILSLQKCVECFKTSTIRKNWIFGLLSNFSQKILSFFIYVWQKSQSSDIDGHRLKCL